MWKALQEVNTHGFSYLPRVLTDEFRHGLLEEIARVEWDRMPDSYLNARQGAYQVNFGAPFDGFPRIAKLGAALSHRVDATSWGLLELDRFWPNEVSLIRYLEDDVGITAHRDEKHYHFLVCAFTLAGRTDFSIIRDRETLAPISRWESEPGSLALLRAPGFNGIDDGRPMHQVGGGKGGERISLVYRVNSQF